MRWGEKEKEPTHLSVITRKTNIKLGILKGGTGKEPTFFFDILNCKKKQVSAKKKNRFSHKFLHKNAICKLRTSFKQILNSVTIKNSISQDNCALCTFERVWLLDRLVGHGEHLIRLIYPPITLGGGIEDGALVPLLVVLHLVRTLLV